MRPYLNPYVAGVGLGLVLLTCFAVTGQGLGASGAFAEAASATIAAVAPKQAAGNDYVQGYLQGGAPWIVFEVLGVVVGGALSAVVAGRFRLEVVHGPKTAVTPRLLAALAGGVLMGVGAVLARGCTSGQALSGGAMLSAGSWAFMVAVFVAGYGVAPLFKRLWS